MLMQNFSKDLYESLKKLLHSLKFKFCQSVYYHTIQINQPTGCNNSSSLLLDVYVQLNMFRASSHPSSGATTTAVAASGFAVGAW
jgi:hypothetical protein